MIVYGFEFPKIHGDSSEGGPVGFHRAASQYLLGYACHRKKGS